MSEEQLLERVLGCATDLKYAIDDTINRAHDLDQAFVLDSSIILDVGVDLTHMHSHALDLCLEFANHIRYAIDRAKTLDLISNLDFVSTLDLAHDLHYALRGPRDLAKQLNFDRAYVHALIDTLSSASDIVGEIVSTLDLKLAVLWEVERINQARTTSSIEAPTRVTVAPLAQKLVDLTMRALPVAHRRRYIEELRAELWDLAAKKATPSMQVLYAIQQLGRVWQLRCELHAPGHRRFEVLHQAVCWVLASQARTWGLIGFVTITALFDVVLQQGPGSAFFAVPTLVGFHSGVEWLRKRWNVTVESRSRSEDE
ncbi:hypothetical protein [Streptosporangium sp. NPDC001681]|uniref:hypothetical protein n=1 Tax=Streptosporangium sp. NPDC001681 TaxID=3154395 RepID=UPI00332CE719